MRKYLFLVGLALLLAPGAVLADNHTNEEDAVRSAALDYLDAFYQADMTFAERSVWDQLAKRGFGRHSTDDPFQGPFFMDYAQLEELVNEYAEKNPTPEDAPRKVTIFEISDQTASLRVDAFWGFDYMHLAKFDGKWKVVNVLWQTHAKTD